MTDQNVFDFTISDVFGFFGTSINCQGKLTVVIIMYRPNHWAILVFMLHKRTWTEPSERVTSLSMEPVGGWKGEVEKSSKRVFNSK